MPIIDKPGGLVSEKASRLNHGGHFSQFELDGLKFTHGLAKGLSLFHMANGLIKGTLGHAHALGCRQDPVDIEEVHDLRKTLPLFPSKEIIFGDSHIIEDYLCRI